MKFDLKAEYFNHQSFLHGIMHTYRVMHNVRIVGQKHNILPSIVSTAFCSAFIHDMARTHDGHCTRHGKWAVDEKLPLFVKKFKLFGLSKEEIATLKTAVTFHSLSEEIDRSHPHYPVTALLKDADALDRIRLGTYGLNPAYLRLPKSKNLIKQAENNYLVSQNSMCESLDELLHLIGESSR